MLKKAIMAVIALVFSVSLHAGNGFINGQGINIKEGLAKLEAPVPAVKESSRKVSREIIGEKNNYEHKKYSETGIKKGNDKLIVAGEFLKDLDAKNRKEFLNGLILMDGRVVSMPTAPLKYSVSKKRMKEIISTFFSSSRKTGKYSKKGKRYSPLVRISDLLKNLPENVETEFLERMIFKNGRVVSLYVGGLKKILSTKQMAGIVKMLEADKTKEDIEKFPKTLCGNGECYEAICSGKPGNRYCTDFKDYVCDITCYSLE